MTIAGLTQTDLYSLADSGFILVSPWKPLILIVTLAGWAWIISAVFDKHAARFFLPRKTWNLVHCSIGLLALGLALLFPMFVNIKGEATFWIGWGIMLLMLFGSLMSYTIVANKDERVPEDFKIRLDIFTKLAASRDEKKRAKMQGTVKLTLRKPDKSVVPAPNSDTPEFETRTAGEKVFIEALAARSSQVDIAPATKDAYGVSQLVDGLKTAAGTIPAADAVKIIDLWKTAAGLDIADRRRKLTGDTSVEEGVNKTLVRVTSVGDRGGMRLSMLFEPAKAVTRKREALGLLPDQMELLKAMVDEGKGLVLLAGMPDNGRTTTMYSLLRMHDAYTSSIQTLELEPQLTLEGIRHQAFDPSADGADFGTTVRSLLRRDPDVLSVAEMLDANTAKEVAKADYERTRVYLGIKADSALAAVDAFLKQVGDNPLAAKNLRGVVCQKLMRRLCTNCRVQYPPTPDMLKKMGIADASKVPALFKKGGQVLIKNKPEVCPVCNGGGYIGQEGIFEIYRFDDEDRALISEGNLTGLKANLRKKNARSIQQTALAKAIAGLTSVEEVMRVTSPPAAPAAPAAPGKPPAAS